MSPWAAFIGGLLLAGVVAGSVGYELGAEGENYRLSRPSSKLPLHKRRKKS
jgi:hypothetical protein